MRIPPISNDPTKVQLVRLSHVYFEHSNLDEFAKFAHDFGFVEERRSGNTIYYRGYGRDPYIYVASNGNGGKAKFCGPAFLAASPEQFEKATKIPGALLRDLNEAPGGGKMITFCRPNNTFMHVVFGQTERVIATKMPPSETHESQGPYNTPFEKPRLGKVPQFRDTLS